MAKELGKRQMRILDVINGMDQGGGTIRSVYDRLKNEFYPNQIEQSTHIYLSHKEWEESSEHRKILNRYRVAMHQSVRRLIHNGYLVKDHATSYINMTQAGKDILKHYQECQ